MSSSPSLPSTSAVLAAIDAASALERRLASSVALIKGISFAEYRLLDAIADCPESRSSRVSLAELVHLSPSGVTRALKPLEKLGFVSTERHERDARQALAVLTDQGHELIADARGVMNDTVAALFDDSTTTPEQCLSAAKTLQTLTRP